MAKSDKKLTDWVAESFRFTAFLKEPVREPPNWWEEMTGDQPEMQNSRPKQGLFQEEGLFGECRLILNINPFRVDWHIAANKKDSDLEIPIIGEFNYFRIKFFEKINSWLGNLKAVNRIAFGAVLLNPVKDLKEGYQRINNLIDNVEIEEGSSDFFYQINIPCKSKVKTDLTINRLTKWSVSEIQSVLIEANQIQNERPNTLVDGKIYTCRLELDINTSQHFSGIFEKKNLFSLFDEIISLGDDLLEKGRL